jgi:rubrerythrin
MLAARQVCSAGSANAGKRGKKMIAALRGAIIEALKREEENLNMFERLASEAKDKKLKDFLKLMAEDTKKNTDMLKHLNLHSIMKFGLRLKFKVPEIEIDETITAAITDVQGAKDILKIALDQLNVNIEYYDHIAEHSIFPESKRMFRILSDKELEDKSKVKAFLDMIE